MKRKQFILLSSILVFLYLGTGVGSAAIVYVPDQSFVLNADGESRSVDLGGFDVPLTFSGEQFGSTGAMSWRLRPSVSNFHEYVRDPSGDPSPERFDAGVEIGEDLSWTPDERGVSILASTGAIGGTFFDAEGFLAISVYEEQFGWENEDALPTYGWIRVSHSEEDMALTVHDWAWNSTAGEPILTGQIPEPATYVMILGVGALGFVVLRRPFWRSDSAHRR